MAGLEVPMVKCDETGRPLGGNPGVLDNAIDLVGREPNWIPVHALLLELRGYRNWAGPVDHQLTAEERRLARWCVLTVAQGFRAEGDGCRAASKLLDRLDEVWGP
jgi:hypothetical protein